MRERVLKSVLIVVGLLFCGMAYPMVLYVRQVPALAMMMSLYATLGIFLLISFRNPVAHRSLIAFAAWSSLAHASLMAVQAWKHFIQPMEWTGVAVFCAIGIALLVLNRTGAARERASSAGAGF